MLAVSRGHTRAGIIVLEGPDGSGKTTLAKTLEGYGYAYEHRGTPDCEALRFYLTPVVSRWRDPLVLDRLHIGSYVYGTIFRSGDDLNEFERWVLEGSLLARGAVVVICRPPTEVMDANLKKRPVDAVAKVYEALEMREPVRSLYDSYTTSTLPSAIYDYTRESAEGLIDRVHDLRRAMYCTGSGPILRSWLPADVPALGNVFTPSRILVGDLSMQSACSVSPWVSDSSRYVFGALRAARHDFGDMCLLNSLLLDDREVSDFVDPTLVIGNPAWVALGRYASERLHRLGVSHTTLPHPQHWRRFHYAQMTTYGQMLCGDVDWGETECLNDLGKAACKGG